MPLLLKKPQFNKCIQLPNNSIAFKTPCYPDNYYVYDSQKFEFQYVYHMEASFKLLPNGNYIKKYKNDYFQIRDAKGGKLLVSFIKEERKFNIFVPFSNRYAAVTSVQNDELLVIWDLKNNKEFLTFSGHLHPIAYIKIHPDGRIVTQDRKGEVRFWEYRNITKNNLKSELLNEAPKE